MSVEMLRGTYDYHAWANRRLFTTAAALGADATREVGKQFSFPTLKGMFAHIYGADLIWLKRWRGEGAGRLVGDADVASMAELRTRWDALEVEQRAFLASLTPGDLERPVNYTSALFGGKAFRLPLGALMQHVANHATHHRSEIATMITMISGSPPGTDRVVYDLITTGQIAQGHPAWR